MFNLRLFMLLSALFAFSVPTVAVEVKIACGGPVGQELYLCKQAVKAWSEKTGHTATVVPSPQTTDQRYKKFSEQLKAGDANIDVYEMDVIWPGLLAEYFIDLRQFISEEEIQEHFPAIIKNNTVNDRLVGMPWYTDVGLLYYRKDLLAKHDAKVPETYSELADTGLRIQTEERQGGNNQIWGYVFEGEDYEGLMCNVMEWLVAYNGGTIVDESGKVTINNPQAITAVDRAAGWVGNIAPPIVTNFREEDARLTFMRGDAVFMRNWPYVWNLLQADDMSPVAGRVDIAPLPKGGERGEHASTLGGWQLGVSKFSKNPEVAADLVNYLTSEKVQKERAVEGSFAPTIRSLYEDLDVLRANPIFAKLQPILDKAVARPTSQTGSHYRDVSTATSTTVHEILQGKESAAKGLAALQDELQQILTSGSQ
jgi:trehalose/maltose transport system substrate-binding protein